MLKEDDKFRFKVNEIVWVELEEQNVKWPALVRKIYSATAQLSIILIDLPKEDRSFTIKTLYSIDEVITFDNADQNIRFLDETKSKYDDSIVSVVQKAEDYTRKKLLGENIDVLINKLLGDNRQLAVNAKQQIKLTNINKTDLLKYLKSGKIDSYLLSIYNESLSSERHTNFKNNLKTNYRSLFDYEEDREDLFNYLKDLFKANFKVDNFDVVEYVVDVWIPDVSCV